MNRKHKRGMTRRQVGFLSALIFVLFAVSMALGEDRFYLKNELSEPIVRFRVSFFEYGGKGHDLIFRNVPSNEEQSQLFGPEWGNGDSNRFITFQGVTASGKIIGNKEPKEFVLASDLIPQLATRFKVIVRANGTLEIYENQ